MWAELGLDLEKHDALLGVLGQVYTDIYLAQKNRPDGMGYYALQFCSPYQMEAPLLERQVEDGGLPVLRIDTDYSQEDVGQLRTRVEAFIEQIQK